MAIDGLGKRLFTTVSAAANTYFTRVSLGTAHDRAESTSSPSPSCAHAPRSPLIWVGMAALLKGQTNNCSNNCSNSFPKNVVLLRLRGRADTIIRNTSNFLTNVLNGVRPRQG